MKRKFTGIILAVMMLTMSVFTGCSLVTTNWDKYYAQVVSTIQIKDDNGKVVDKIEITKKELITAYNSYGYQYEQNYGQSREDAITSTLEQIESRKLTIRAAEAKFKAENNGQSVLTDEEKSYLWLQTNNALENNFMSYVNQVTGTTTPEDKEEDTATKFNGYAKQAELGPNDEILKEKTTTDLLDGFNYDEANKKDATKKEDKDLIYNNLLELVRSVGGNTYSKAYNEYRKALVKSEEGLKKITDKSVEAMFAREIDRIYTILYENYIVEKYTESFKSNSNISNVTTAQMLELYQNKVMNSYTKYVLENDGNYEEDVLSDLSKINYFKTGDGATKFYTVSHILFKFTDTQSTAYKTAKENIEKGIDVSKNKEIISDLYDAITPTVREKQGASITADPQTGTYVEVEASKITDYEKSVTTLYNHIKKEVEAAGDELAKARVFNKFIYKYNEDPGIMNAEYNYVMGLNASQATADDHITVNGIDYKSYSKMVEEFTLAGAELYNGGAGQIGDLSGLCMTENGIHILMYTGECKNYFDSIVNGENGQQVVLGPRAIDTLATARLNVCVGKTIFDKLYEELNKDNFSSFQSEHILTLRDGCEFLRNPKTYKDLLKD